MEESKSSNNVFNTGIILSLIGSWITTILLCWTVIFLVFGILNILWLNKIKKGQANDKIIMSSVVSIIFGGILGIIGGIMMLVDKPESK